MAKINKHRATFIRDFKVLHEINNFRARNYFSVFLSPLSPNNIQGVEIIEIVFVLFEFVSMTLLLLFLVDILNFFWPASLTEKKNRKQHHSINLCQMDSVAYFFAILYPTFCLASVLLSVTDKLVPPAACSISAHCVVPSPFVFKNWSAFPFPVGSAKVEGEK